MHGRYGVGAALVGYDLVEVCGRRRGKMVHVSPFRGLRYDQDIAGDWGGLLGPPYDIVSESQTAALRASSPYQIAHVEMASGDDGIAVAAELLQSWRTSGALVQDETPAYYLHEHRFADASGTAQVRRALFCAVDLRPWGDGVMAHERTMPGPKATRTALRSVVGADISPLMAFVPDRDGRLASLIDAARALPLLYEGEDPTGDRHTLRRIDDPATVSAITAMFAADTIYMADGHHRYESALASIDERPGSGRVLMGVASAQDPALTIGANHRVAYTTTPSDMLARLSSLFDVREVAVGALAASLPDGSSSIGLVTTEGAWLLAATDASREAMPSDVPLAWHGLAPAILQYVILEPLLGIDASALAGGATVSYIHELDEVLSLVASGAASAGFALPAATLQDVVDTADAGSFMPQKSTYFIPKLPTGLVLHPLD